MKNHLISNTLLSSSILLILFLVDLVLPHKAPGHYYFTIGFFFVTYLIQVILIYSLGRTPASFNVIYNLTTMLKMLLSLSFLVIYFLVISKNSQTTETITFSTFFIIIYFIYLIVNTKLFFINKNE